MNLKEDLNIFIDGKKYPVIIKKNKMFQKNIYFRYKDGKFYISASKLTNNNVLLKKLENVAPGLLKKVNKEKYFDNNGAYIFGEYVPFSEGFIKLNGKYYLFKDEKTFYKNVKKEYYSYFLSRIRYYEKIMNIKVPYSLTLRLTKTRYGSNSKKTHNIMINLIMIHYSKGIIDSLVVHELSHEFHRNHQASFYKCVLTYCPNYYILDKKLKGGTLK